MARTIAMLVGFAAVGVWAQTPPQPDAESACKALNLSLKIELMHGFGECTWNLFLHRKQFIAAQPS